MLETILKEKRCFKLICGAGNEDVQEIEKLVAIYAKAGANFFDLCAKEEIVEAAQKGLRRVIPEDELKNYHLCVSVGIKGDPHVSKALIDQNKCINCGMCDSACMHKAILSEDGKYFIDKIRCIGCGHCKEACPSEAINFYCENKSLEQVIPPLVKKGIDCIELHALGTDEDEVEEKWNSLTEHFKGMLSICVDRSHLGNVKLIDRIKRLISERSGFSTIVQADGAPMSGSKDTFKTTLQTIATAEVVQNAQIPVFILLSGGTNSKSTELAKLCGVEVHGVAIGSFARKIVRSYLDRTDLFENDAIMNEAAEVAKELVNKSLEFMR